MKKLEAEEYEQAISIFTESINLYPNKTAFYNRALAYYKINKLTEYCQDIQQASYSSFKDSQKLLNTNCIESDTVYVNSNNTICDSSVYQYMKITKTSKQLGFIQFSVYDRSSKQIFGYSVEDNDTIYTALPDEMPIYPGGEQALVDFLAKNLRYPDKARDKGITGNVFVTFIVDKTGKVTKVKLLRGIGGGCDEEAIRVVKLMPPWQPGYYNNNSVAVRYNLPIRFSLQRISY